MTAQQKGYNQALQDIENIIKQSTSNEEALSSIIGLMYLKNDTLEEVR